MIDRYARQTLFFPNGAADQERLRRARVAVVGCGALGTIIAPFLVRAGVGFLRIIDRDFVDLTNLQRQALFDEEDIRANLPKAVAAARKLALANSEVAIEPVTADFDADNAERLLADVDLVMDATDNFEARYVINEVCVKHSRPWIYSAAVASYGVTMTIRPNQTPCLRCLFPVAPAPGTAETCETVGVIGPICGVIGSLAAAEALKLLIGAEDRLRVGLLWVDVWSGSFQLTPFATPVADCAVCQRGRFERLERGASGLTAALCGRGAVQVRPADGREVKLSEIAARLQASGQVLVNEYLLRFRAEDFELTLFPDARAIIKGTDDPARARSIYARYIGI